MVALRQKNAAAIQAMSDIDRYCPDSEEGNCSDLRGSTSYPASHRGAAKHGICFASGLRPLKREQLPRKSSSSELFVCLKSMRNWLHLRSPRYGSRFRS